MRTAAEPVESAAVAADAMEPRLHRIKRFRAETHDTFTVELRPEGGGPTRRWLPGQFNMVYVFGAGEIPISISGDPRATCSSTRRARSGW